jgi:hypothetical protein
VAVRRQRVKTVTDIFKKLCHLVAKTNHITATRIYNVPSKTFSPLKSWVQKITQW